ncbi:hypothetical protein ACT4TS_001176 [Enterobacter roggenkampii]
MIKKVWHFVKPYITNPVVAFSGGGVVWMLLDVFVTKGIDASFVSAVMDTVMAGAAILALIEATKIWLNKSKEDGYKISLDLLNHKFINTVMDHKLSSLLFSNYGVISSYLTLNNEWDNTEQVISRERTLQKLLVKQLEELEEKLFNSIFPLSQEVQFDIFRMRNTGVDFADNEFGRMLNQHFSNLLSTSIECENYIQCIKYFIKVHQIESVDNGLAILKNRGIIHDYLNEMLNYNKKINNLVKVNRQNLNEITLLKTKTVKDYFKYS